VPGSLNSSVANSLLKVAEVEKEEVVLDPMCGSGVIALEAYKLGAKAIAGDIDKERIKIAEQNKQSKKTEAEFHVWDARKTGLKEKSVDKIISNLPFEKQTSISGFNETFFNDFLKEMIRISKDDACFVFLTQHPDIITSACKILGKFTVETKEIVNSGLASYIIKIKKL
jgi:tRNA G10  N-methylase Trm11